MTAIAIWRNDEVEGNPSLWAAADSRVSKDGGRLIDDAVKIFSLPIICRRPAPNGFFTEAYFAHTLGYCFTGSTLMAQNAFLGLSPLLSNLVSPTSFIPAVTDIAHQILAYLKATFDDYKSVGAKHSLFEVAVFGYCLREQRLEIHHFRTQKIAEKYEVVLESHMPLVASDFLYLGDDSIVMGEEISRALSSQPQPGRPPARAPRYVIQDWIADNRNPSIGGDLQLAIADKYGFRPLALVKPYVSGQPKSYISYLGRELTDELTFVGEARASPLMMG